MATLLIDIRDVTTQPIKGDTVTLTAPAPRPATGGGVTRPFNRLVPLVDGKATVEVDRGPLRVTFHDGYGREVVIDTRVPDEGDVFTLRDLIVAHVGTVDDVPGISEALDGKADKSHGHEIDDVTDLRTVLSNHAAGIEGKAPAEHSHALSDVRGLQDALDGKAAKSHTHGMGDVSGLQPALDGKASKAHNHTIAEIKDLIWSLDQKVSVTDLEESTKRYASAKIAELVDGAPESLDTLREVAEEFKNQDEAIEAVFIELGKRAMRSHTHAIGDVTGLKTALDGKVNVSDVTDSLSAVSFGKVVKREDGGLAIRAGEPEQEYHAATKRYVDALGAKKAEKTELAKKLDASEVTDSLSAVSFGKVVKREDGGLAIRAGEPEQSYHAATKRYVDGEVAKKADKSALDGKVNVADVTDSLSAVSFGKVVKREDGGLAIRAGEPEQSYHAATKRYVDGEVAKKADKSALDALTVLTEASGNGWMAARRGSVVTLRIDRLQNGPSVDALPVSMRPTVQTYIPLSDLGGNPTARAAVNPGGTVTGTDIKSIAFGVATYVV